MLDLLETKPVPRVGERTKEFKRHLAAEEVLGPSRDLSRYLEHICLLLSCMDVYLECKKSNFPPWRQKRYVFFCFFLISSRDSESKEGTDERKEGKSGLMESFCSLPATDFVLYLE